MRRPVLLSALLSLGLALPALAASPAEMQNDEARADLKAATEACDRGAAMPLDPEATAPPVQFFELIGPTFDIEGLKKIAAECKTAVSGAPADKRLTLQWIRTRIALGIDDPSPVLPDLRAAAAAGSPEANYLIYQLYRAADAGGPVGREEGLAALKAAAEAGHQEALQGILTEYLEGPHIRRDFKEAARYAGLLMKLPQQGARFAAKSEDAARDDGKYQFGNILVSHDGFSDAEYAQGFAIMKELYEAKDSRALAPYITALRYGRGVDKDAAAARKLAEEAVAGGNADALPFLADMLAEAEGGPADGKRALTLLQGDLADKTPGTKPILARLLLDNRYVGRQPRKAIQLLLNSPADIDSWIKVAPLLADYDEGLQYPEPFLTRFAEAADVGEPGAAMALAKLKLTGHAQFGNDVEGARAILKKLAADGDAEAAVLYAETQYNNLTSTSYRPSRREDGMSDAEIEALIDKATAQNRASAFRLKAELLRAGVIYPQDDGAASKALLAAAEGGDVAAMLMLGDAYDDGLGIAKDPRERLRWWREAARLGSLEARKKFADAFTFDSFDRLMTLREGVTEKIALYNNSSTKGMFGDTMAEMQLSGAFSGSRAGDAGTAVLAAAIMDGFREAPAGLDDAKLVPLLHVLEDDVRIEIEKKLAADGFYKGAPEGYGGPEVRKALADWVDAKGPLPDEAEATAAATTSDASSPAATAAGVATPGKLSDELIARVTRQAMAETKAARSKKQRREALRHINTLAQYGDVGARWAFVNNYHKDALIASVTTPEEVTRYGLDIMVTHPAGIDKAEFEVIFDVTEMLEQHKIGAFAKAMIAAIRDDPRLQDPLTLGGIMEQMAFAPGACDAILREAKSAGADALGEEGCDDTSRAAIIAFAKAKGPAGVEQAAREAAAKLLTKMDAAASP